MKLIFSRKGFDSAAGGCASPILPDGQMISLPIPEPRPRRPPLLTYAGITAGDISLARLVQDLSRGRVRPSTPVHLDPDLVAGSLPRPPGWRPLFGQAAAAESHLHRQEVTAGDIFLFYGWFRQVEKVQGHYRYRPGAPDLHVIFGWLQVEQRLDLAAAAPIPEWARQHPHGAHPGRDRWDALYLSTPRLDLPGASQAGAGVFPRFHPRLCLTDPAGLHRSRWRLPRWFHGAGRRSWLSYHGNPDRWHLFPDFVQLQTVGRGQEFVLDGDDYPEVTAWLQTLFTI